MAEYLYDNHYEDISNYLSLDEITRDVILSNLSEILENEISHKLTELYTDAWEESAGKTGRELALETATDHITDVGGNST